MADVEVLVTSVPDADILCLFAPQTECGWIEGTTKAVFDPVERPSVISMSYRSDSSANPVGLTKKIACELNTIFAEAACRGTTVVVASGDRGGSATKCRNPAGRRRALLPCFLQRALTCLRAVERSSL